MNHFKQFSRLYFPLGLLVLIVVAGVIGFSAIEGYTLFEALYMTTITVATVGFQEVHPLSDAGRMFTIILIITSFGTFAFAITSITRYIMDGEFREYFKIKRLTSELEKLENHVIICGYGRNGKQAARVLKSHNQRFVVIEQKGEPVQNMSEKYPHLVITGDATQDEVLMQAGIQRARAVVTTLPVDADNLFIVLSARTLNRKLNIISRASDDNSDKKLKTAGADHVIMPDMVGGAHMASLVMKPDIVEFIDYVTGVGVDINLDEIAYENLPQNLQNKTIRELEVRNKSGANIIGFKTAKGEYVINPSAETILIPNAKLFVLGTSDQINKLRELFS
ncbi:MAG: potassium channel protein [Nitrospirae bacterium]|nr:MAG: potassium channel protein [Bacteroidota bacterium]TAN40296.1 MAG: potassium channel protein [Nitrospirota bacterium]